MARNCILRCLNNLHPPIVLPHNQNYVIGRSKETKIKSKRCSKAQVELLSDYTSFTVTVRQIGPNVSGVNCKPLLYGNTAHLKHNDTLEILLGEYDHRIEFEPPPENTAAVNNHPTACFEMPQRRSGAGKTESKRNSSEEQKSRPEPKRSRTEAGSSEKGWEEYADGALLVFKKNMEGRAKVACYDMDGTLITTKSGKVFAQDYNDWKIIYAEVPGKLKQLYDDGYKIVIMSNQAGIASGKHTVAGVQKKIGNIIDKLGVPIQALVSTGKGEFRKPAIGMWTFLKNEANGGIEIDMKESMFVGDAAGRPAQGSKKKKDFSISDRLFALNVGLPFFTPEEHFLGTKAQTFNMPEFDPRAVDDSLPLFEPPSTKVPKHKVEVIILVGYPGSGKSFFSSTHLAGLGYIQANRDTVGSWQKCVSIMEKSLKDGKHVVIDNTNPDAESRKRYIDAAKKLNVPVRCFVFNISKDHSRHNNKFRELSGADHTKVNDMIYNMYKSKYNEPNIKEGFDDIVKVNFIPKFRTAKEEKLYRMFLLEK
ncbi:uncharacterized protein F21D5.5 isoform X1 [Panulirus ornatus]|uniref:uncharacterized protein F21D5.5 isoform X1 n=1 Tax=Panulirus ornatus TaxID=150431 RepID=UPI003A8A64DF